MLSIRLNEETEKNLKQIAKFEGLSISDYVRKIIEEKLEDSYDLKLAKLALEEYEKSEKKTYSFEEVFNKWVIN